MKLWSGPKNVLFELCWRKRSLPGPQPAVISFTSAFLSPSLSALATISDIPSGTNGSQWQSLILRSVRNAKPVSNSCRIQLSDSCGWRPLLFLGLELQPHFVKHLNSNPFGFFSRLVASSNVCHAEKLLEIRCRIVLRGRRDNSIVR